MLVGQEDLHECLGAAQALTAGAKVALEWNHDYVTIGGSSGPDRWGAETVPCDPRPPSFLIF